MNDINTLNKKELEEAFAEDFSSPTFPILGELYLKNKEFHRAKKVCMVGLKHDPENVNGYYILAKVYLHNNELIEAEKILKIIIDKNPLHINALKLIVRLHEELDVSKKIKLKYLKVLSDIFPGNNDLINKISIIDKEYVEKKDSLINNKININSSLNIQKSINFNIQPNMATLTFVEILKKQKHYNEALHVLSIVESKLGNSKKTEQLRDELKKLLSELS